MRALLLHSLCACFWIRNVTLAPSPNYHGEGAPPPELVDTKNENDASLFRGQVGRPLPRVKPPPPALSAGTRVEAIVPGPRAASFAGSSSSLDAGEIARAAGSCTAAARPVSGMEVMTTSCAYKQCSGNKSSKRRPTSRPEKVRQQKRKLGMGQGRGAPAGGAGKWTGSGTPVSGRSAPTTGKGAGGRSKERVEEGTGTMVACRLRPKPEDEGSGASRATSSIQIQPRNEAPLTETRLGVEAGEKFGGQGRSGARGVKSVAGRDEGTAIADTFQRSQVSSQASASSSGSTAGQSGSALGASESGSLSDGKRFDINLGTARVPELHECAAPEAEREPSGSALARTGRPSETSCFPDHSKLAIKSAELLRPKLSEEYFPLRPTSVWVEQEIPHPAGVCSCFVPKSQTRSEPSEPQATSVGCIGGVNAVRVIPVRPGDADILQAVHWYQDFIPATGAASPGAPEPLAANRSESGPSSPQAGTGGHRTGNQSALPALSAEDVRAGEPDDGGEQTPRSHQTAVGDGRSTFRQAGAAQPERATVCAPRTGRISMTDAEQWLSQRADEQAECSHAAPCLVVTRDETTDHPVEQAGQSTTDEPGLNCASSSTRRDGGGFPHRIDLGVTAPSLDRVERANTVAAAQSHSDLPASASTSPPSNVSAPPAPAAKVAATTIRESSGAAISSSSTHAVSNPDLQAALNAASLERSGLGRSDPQGAAGMIHLGISPAALVSPTIAPTSPSVQPSSQVSSVVPPSQTQPLPAVAVPNSVRTPHSKPGPSPLPAKNRSGAAPATGLLSDSHSPDGMGVLVPASSFLPRNYVLAKLRENGLRLQYLKAEEWQSDCGLVTEAVSENGAALAFAEDDACRSMKSICLSAVSGCGRSLQFCGPGLRGDAMIVELAIRNGHKLCVRGPAARQGFTAEGGENKDNQQQHRQSSPGVLLRAAAQGALRQRQTKFLVLSEGSQAQKVGPSSDAVLSTAPITATTVRLLQQMKPRQVEHVLQLQQQPQQEPQLEDLLQTENPPLPRELTDESLWRVSPLKFASAELQGEKTVCIDAVRIQGNALEFCAPGLQNDSEVVRHALAQDREGALPFVSAELQARWRLDEEFFHKWFWVAVSGSLLLLALGCFVFWQLVVVRRKYHAILVSRRAMQQRSQREKRKKQKRIETTLVSSREFLTSVTDASCRRRDAAFAESEKEGPSLPPAEPPLLQRRYPADMVVNVKQAHVATNGKKKNSARGKHLRLSKNFRKVRVAGKNNDFYFKPPQRGDLATHHVNGGGPPVTGAPMAFGFFHGHHFYGLQAYKNAPPARTGGADVYGGRQLLPENKICVPHKVDTSYYPAQEEQEVGQGRHVAAPGPEPGASTAGSPAPISSSAGVKREVEYDSRGNVKRIRMVVEESDVCRTEDVRRFGDEAEDFGATRLAQQEGDQVRPTRSCAKKLMAAESGTSLREGKEKTLSWQHNKDHFCSDDKSYSENNYEFSQAQSTSLETSDMRFQEELNAEARRCHRAFDGSDV
ncbi:unnamed protein product [Amoebophrya sp. A120]|nr:unnamed protein product [Amoebophrya sp. A120]|eukprot:GSA120T00002879001.1